MWYIVFHLVLAQAQYYTPEENSEIQAKCGRYKSSNDFKFKVYDGEVVNSKAAPWMAGLGRTKNVIPPEMCSPQARAYCNKQISINFCGGTLISPRHVLTALHCLKVENVSCNRNGSPDILSYMHQTADWTIVFKQEIVLRYDLLLPLGKNITYGKVSKVYHSGLANDGRCNLTKSGDIAVFELTEDVPYAHDLYYACLSDTPLKNYDEMKFFGYGDDKIIAKVAYEVGMPLKTYSTAVHSCNSRYKRAKDVKCTKGNKMACSGDSGGGYIMNRNGKETIGAILSGGLNCSMVFDREQRGMKVQFTDDIVDVAYHLPWICKATGICPYTLIDSLIEDKDRLKFTTVNVGGKRAV